jgi:hypothetical protein
LVNFDYDERHEFMDIMLLATTLVCECKYIVTFEEGYIVNCLNKAELYKTKLEKYETDNDWETHHRGSMIDELNLLISKLESLKKNV